MKKVLLSVVVLAMILASFSAHASNNENCPFRNMTKNSKLLRGDDNTPRFDVATKKLPSKAVSVTK